MAAPAAPPGTFVQSAQTAGRTYQRFNVIAGNRYRVDLCNTLLPANTLLFIHSNTSPFTQVTGVCDDDGCGTIGGHASVLFNPTVSGTYRAYFYLNTCGTPITATVQLRVTYLGPNTPPPNDEPCGATLIPSPLPNNCSSITAGTTVGATQTLTPGSPTTLCTAPSTQFNGGDVWFQVAVPPSGLIAIETTDGGVCAGAFGLYRSSTALCTGTLSMLPGSGANIGLCSIEGFNAPSGGDAGVSIDAFALGLAANEIIYIRYWERNANENGAFSICAYEPLPPVNDNPCTPFLLPTPGTCVTPVEYNTTNAQPLSSSMTLSPPLTCVGAPDGGDVWFQFTVPPSGALTIEASAGTLDEMAMSWYRLTAGTPCAGTLTQIACDNNAGPGNMPRINSQLAGIAPPLVAGQTIYVRLFNDLNALQGTFNLCVTENIPPTNDNPCGAISLDVTPTCSPVSGTTENASQTANAFPGGTIGVPYPVCAGLIPTDVWYTVTVPSDLPAPYGIAFQTTAGTLLNGAFQVYAATGSCATNNLALTPLGGCQNGGAGMPNLTLNVPTISPGQQLYVRVWREAGADGTFNICAQRTDPTLCIGNVTDPGGPLADYGNSLTTTDQYCSTKAGDAVTLTFSQFDLEQGWDFLSIYDGTSAGAPLIGTYTGTNSPGVVTASISALNPTGCLTLVFTSDFIIVRPGYLAKITCAPGVAQVPPVGDCGSFVYDPGGVGAGYPINIGNPPNPTWTAFYCPNNPGDVVTLDWSTFQVENNWDHLYIYYGTSAIPANLISSGNPAGFAPNNGPGAWWGAGIPDISGNPAIGGGCLFLEFYSDASVTGNWAAQVICGPPPPPPPPPGLSCGNTFLDPGGAGNYANNVDVTYTICAPAGQVVNVTFNQFSLEANWDKLYVYDGPNTASPQIASTNGTGNGPTAGPGSFWGTAIPGPFISSGQCLTFRFITDFSIISSGWSASITCAPRAPNDNPCAPFPATVLPVTPSCSYTTSNNTNAGSTPGISNAGCGNYQGGDVWFKFTTPLDGEVLITTEAGTLTDGGMAVYSAASCAGPFVMVECDDDDGPGNMPEIDRRCNPLAPSTVYYVRVWGYSGARGSFGICVTEGYTATPQGDCLGAFTLCTGDPVSAGFANPGCTNDLSNINWGCLAGGERIGSWYAFAANTSGTLGMTITPSGNEDYDWAIWGPFPAGNTMSTLCPLPTGAPKRCSYTSSNVTNTVTGDYATGMGINNVAWANPQFGAPATPYTDVIDGWTPGFSSVNVGEIFIMFVNDYHHTGSGYSVTWQMGSPNMLDCMILPVELLELEAHPRTSTVDLTWSTASENNSSHFVVQRSGDGERFEQIGTVTAAGTTQQLTRYAFTDQFPLMGVNYYRLTQVDFDGASALSNMVSAEFKQRTEVIVVPNPAHDNAELVFSETQEQLLIIRITDSGGRAVGEMRSMEGVQRVTLPIEKLERGTYFVRITTAEGAPHGVVPFVKQ
ncbi:MAG: T9SS type A sorting domain-containing protein [Flavobacteriales bacterium]|nr:T9SS type A sorting domain-containing protein [Flavobacteriales bacterium]MBK6946273.1 T9SS type A sorting domain-containing protein [Flavobacteriales bacterium]MBP9138001.1 T9SS type A sorting domain-containing protein [Flavobacteriales bacterium]HQV52528.1 T9SS type A sorting domain-containing protein [Flavobacteriales bacterium]HQX29516.1 T9SS type A sorting domain-containing protein [Flavobacteriales bacterium]